MLPYAQLDTYFTSYPSAFDDGNHRDDPLRYTRANSGTMLADDVAMVLLSASKHVIKNKESLTGSQMQQALAGLTGSNALQGVTGRIAFDSNGNPTNRAFTVVCNEDRKFKLDMVYGQFLVN